MRKRSIRTGGKIYQTFPLDVWQPDEKVILRMQSIPDLFTGYLVTRNRITYNL
jgi:hypothetical protein